jgi:Uma2 family endonuclease
MNEKFNVYEKHGVREYWVIDPSAWSLWMYRLSSSGHYDEGELRDRLGVLSPVESRVLVGFTLDPERLFADLD